MGSSGGGGSSGKVDFPTYMKDWQAMVLDDTGTDTLTESITSVMEAAIGNSPFTTMTAYDPDTVLATTQSSIDGFIAILAGLDDETDWEAYYDTVYAKLGVYSGVFTIAPVTDIPAPTAVSDISDVEITEAEIVADVDAFADQLDDEITTKVLPRFEAGMRDINAVVSSAFVIGRSVIEGFRDRDVAKHNSALRLAVVDKNAMLELEVGKVGVDVEKYNSGMLQDSRKYNTDRRLEYHKLNKHISLDTRKMADSRQRLYLDGVNQLMQLMNQRITWTEALTKTVVEANRIKIVAKKEQNDTDNGLEEQDALWDLEVFRHGGNLLASISGGTSVQPEQRGPSKAASAIGGALSGAAAGAMIGGAANPIAGPVIGGVIGAAASLIG